MIRYPSALPTAECLAEWPNPDGEPHECMVAAHIEHRVHVCACGANDGGERAYPDDAFPAVETMHYRAAFVRGWRFHAETRRAQRDAAVLALEVFQERNPCICDPNPETTDGPQEDCPEHGRPYAYWVEGIQVVMAQRDAALAREGALRAGVEALLGDKRVPNFDDENFVGFVGGPEHRTVGPHRAWCYDVSEWCYPSIPCSSCGGTVDAADLRALLVEPGGEG